MFMFIFSGKFVSWRVKLKRHENIHLQHTDLIFSHILKYYGFKFSLLQYLTFCPYSIIICFYRLAQNLLYYYFDKSCKY